MIERRVYMKAQNASPEKTMSITRGCLLIGFGDGRDKSLRYIEAGCLGYVVQGFSPEKDNEHKARLFVDRASALR